MRWNALFTAVIVCCAQIVNGAGFYYLFTTSATMGNFGGLASAKTSCEQAVALYGFDNSKIHAMLFGSSILSSWDDSRNVVSLVNASVVIATGDFFKAGTLSYSLKSVGLCPASGYVWTGFTNNFVDIGNNCLSWASANSGERGSVLDCTQKSAGSLYIGAQTCGIGAGILCIYEGTTGAPSTAPSKTPSKSPTTSRPSINPTTSRPTLSPTTSRPSTSPTTSVPTQSPARSSKAPTTSAPVLSEGSGTDLSVIGIPIGVGVGGGLLFLLVLTAIFVTRNRKAQARKDVVTASMGNSGK